MKNDQNPATTNHTITTARRPDNIRSSILVRGRSIRSMARSGCQPRRPCPERIHIFAILVGFFLWLYMKMKRPFEGKRVLPPRKTSLGGCQNNKVAVYCISMWHQVSWPWSGMLCHRPVTFWNEPNHFHTTLFSIFRRFELQASGWLNVREHDRARERARERESERQKRKKRWRERGKQRVWKKVFVWEREKWREGGRKEREREEEEEGGRARESKSDSERERAHNYDDITHKQYIYI